MFKSCETSVSSVCGKNNNNNNNNNNYDNDDHTNNNNSNKEKKLEGIFDCKLFLSQQRMKIQETSYNKVK